MDKYLWSMVLQLAHLRLRAGNIELYIQPSQVTETRKLIKSTAHNVNYLVSSASSSILSKKLLFSIAF